MTKLSDNSTVTTSSFHGVERKEIYLKYLPIPDRIDYTPSENTITLITNEGTTLTTQLATSLTNKGHQVVILNLMQTPPNSPFNNNFNSVHLKHSNNEQIAAVIHEIQSKYGKIAHFIHLHSIYKFQFPLLP